MHNSSTKYYYLYHINAFCVKERSLWVLLRFQGRERDFFRFEL